MDKHSVSAVVVNYNSGSWLSRCLFALNKSSLQEIIVVDNGSSDQSLECLGSAANSNVELIRNTDNPGYATACNQGIARTDSEFILLLNPDCELLDNALAILCASLVENKRAMIAGPWVINPEGEVQRATMRRLPTFNISMHEVFLPRSGKGVELSHHVKPEGTQVAEAVSGACLLIRSTQLQEIGGFDVDYRLHCEDLDLMHRAALAGYSVLLVPDALVVHQQGVSSRSRPLWVEWQKHRGMWRYYQKFEAPDNSLLKQLVVGISILGHYILKAPVIWYQKLFSRTADYE
ncbi:MAG: glycosyltransferase family 2 protein [Proteobacteria bacterium]|nr:glycosyltransferase family 2 protein [Pseudomonadota bacterium]